MKDILNRMQLDEINRRLSQLEVGEELNITIDMNVGSKVMCDIYDGVAPFESEIVEMTCFDCGTTFVGVQEKVAHLIAQHQIIHQHEQKQIAMHIGTLDDQELREDWEVSITSLATLFEQHPDMRRAIHGAVKHALLIDLHIETHRGDE
jgi:hypothetical protein